MKKSPYICEFVSSIGIVAVVILTMLQAVMRSFFNTGISWTNESLFMCQIILVYFIIPVLFCERENIRVDVFVHLLPKKLWNVCWIFVECISLVFCAIMFASITQFLQKTWNNATAIMEIPNWLYYGSIWVSMLLSIICIVFNITLSIFSKKEVS